MCKGKTGCKFLADGKWVIIMKYKQASVCKCSLK